MGGMRRLLGPLARTVTYTRVLHLGIPLALLAVWMFVDPSHPYVPLLFLVPIGLLPGMRLAEGVQAQLLLTPRERSGPDPVISAGASATWADRWRTVLWLEARSVLSVLMLGCVVWLPLLGVDLIARAAGHTPPMLPVLSGTAPRVWCAVLAPVPLVVAAVGVVTIGRLAAAVARRLLGPSPAERLAALEERTEQLLERTRIARELHDSIGHALTVAVLQAGAARAAGDAAFTDRALGTIEETGRAALEDLERVLLVLRESARPASQRPTLVDAGRLLDSARASGALVEATVTGPLERVPAPVSREGYRILQEALTNVLRHAAGAAQVRVCVEVTGAALGIEVTNPFTCASFGPPTADGPTANGPTAADGGGLRGIKERAALLGGEAQTGLRGGEWRVSALLPLDGRAAGVRA